jgi:hypothetical protein
VAWANAEIEASARLIAGLDAQAEKEKELEEAKKRQHAEFLTAAAEAMENTREMEQLASDAIAKEIQANSARMAAEREDEVAKERRKAEEIKAIRQELIDFTIDLAGSLATLSSVRTQRELAELTAKQNKELENFEGTEEEKDALMKKFEKERAKIEYEGALNSWRLQLAAAVVSGAKAVLSGFQTVPFIPAGLLAGGLATALAAIQIETIRESKPIPSFAEGGHFTVPPGFPDDSFLMAAESGERVSITPAGSTARSSTREVVFNLNGREFARFIQNELDDGRVLVSRGRLKR